MGIKAKENKYDQQHNVRCIKNDMIKHWNLKIS